MAKRTKTERTRKGRTRVKDLPKNEKVLTPQQSKRIKGGLLVVIAKNEPASKEKDVLIGL